MNNEFDIVILFSAFNRYESTLSTINFFSSNLKSNNITYKIVVVDDMSTDETSSLKSSENVEVIRTKGDYFYTRSMDFGFKWIKKNILSFNSLLCINDDVLFNNEVFSLIDKGIGSNKDILVGCCSESIDSNIISYGFVKSHLFNVSLFKTLNDTNPHDFTAFNFNCVLIKKSYLDENVFFDTKFTHSKGDIDFSLLAKKNKANISGFNNPIGVCSKKDGRVNPYDSQLSILKRYELLLSVKWHPLKETYIFHRKHNPYFWFFTFPIPYVKWLFSIIK